MKQTFRPKSSRSKNRKKKCQNTIKAYDVVRKAHLQRCVQQAV